MIYSIGIILTTNSLSRLIGPVVVSRLTSCSPVLFLVLFEPGGEIVVNVDVWRESKIKKFLHVAT